jgi:hypothetical protein
VYSLPLFPGTYTLGCDTGTYDGVTYVFEQGGSPSDTTPPGVSVAKAVLSGTVSDNSGSAAVKVNGVTMPVSAGTWSSGDIALTGASTTVTVAATDPSGNTRTGTVTVSQ